MKLGSLFDGSGGFPLAGVLHGVEPVWASEIEPYPVRVTTARFPAMKHLGDVTKIDGAAIEPVDIITFGSPCQDLSVAGKQAGLHKGERSNLFFEAIRIIKEMRRSTDGIYPRIAIWENVPGAFSSNKGADFQAVLQAFCSVKDETTDVPRPSTGKWNRAGAIVGNGWSIAWRTFDAQYWGVPQRRKRIYLIADFGSERAGEVLFVGKSVHGHSAESGTAGESATGDAAGSVGRGVQCLNSSMPQTSRIYSADGVYPCLTANGTGGLNRQAVLFEPMSALEENWAESSVKNALRAGASKSSHAVCYIPSQFAKYVDGKPILRASGGDLGGGSEGLVCYPIDSHQQDSRFKICEDGVCPTVPGQMGTGGNNGPMVLETYQKVTGPLMANSHPGSYSGQDAYSDMLVTQPSKPPRKYIVRRLTPLECLRLQGLPDGWLDGVDGSDSAKYKMLGNGIAMPNAIYVVGCAVKLIKETQT